MKIAFRIFAALCFIGIISAVGFFAYNAGVEQGITQAPTVAKAIEKAAENGQAPLPPMYGHGYGYAPYGYNHHPHFGFFPIGGICFSIFVLFFFLGMMKMMFFRRMRHGWGHHGHCGGREGMLDEWHKRAHGESSAEGADKSA